MPVKCKYCNSTEETYETKGPHKGAYCAQCGEWKKWLNKKELRALRYEPESTYEQKEPSPYDGDDNDGMMPWEE